MLKREDVPHTFDFEALKRVESERDALLARVIELEESYASLKASTYGQALEARECRAKIKDHLLAEAKAEARVAELEEQYGELIFAVATKYPDETRHQTALRYIQQAENREDSPACELKP